MEWIASVYALDEKRLQKSAPFGVTVFRSRLDFQRRQREVAPEIAAMKGSGYAEGLAGFYSPKDHHIWMWDADADTRSSLPEVAYHEMTHWMNDLVRAGKPQFPVWFEEGSATYFQTYTPGVTEPEPNLGALRTVLEELDAGTGYTGRQLRSIPYARFYSREYCWGCSFVSFARRAEGGRLWPRLLEYLEKAGSGPTGDAEEHRLLEALHFASDEALDQAWHESVQKLLEQKEPRAKGANAASLESVRALTKPSHDEAVLLARLGRDLARLGLAKEAVVYLEAALRGGVEDASLEVVLARALAVASSARDDEPWPEAARGHLEDAVALAPLVAEYRAVLGVQEVLAVEAKEPHDPKAAAAARDHLGLALLLAGPDDDAAWIAAWTLRAVTHAMPDATVEEQGAWLAEKAPRQAAFVRTAETYVLQEEERWDELIGLLERQRDQAHISAEGLSMLAGLYSASGRYDEAVKTYQEALQGEGASLSLWPRYVAALLGAGDPKGALAAAKEAYQAFDESPAPSDAYRRAIERLFEGAK